MAYRNHRAPQADDPQLPSMTDFEAALQEMFGTAVAAGECFLDVTASKLAVKVCGTGGGSASRGRAMCCSLMKRMMIPGDSDLSGCYRMNPTSLLIRYRLPR